MRRSIYKTIIINKDNKVVGYWSIALHVKFSLGIKVSSYTTMPFLFELGLGIVTFEIYKALV